MQQLGEFLLKIKFPTITLVGLLLYAGVYLLNSSSSFVSTQGIAGAALIFLAAILAIIAFVDFRYKEQNESVIKNLGDGMGALSKALKDVGKTHSAIEKSTRDSLDTVDKTRVGRDGAYTVQPDIFTQTE